MSKILIYYNKNELKPIGGPSGYLYNLVQGLKKINEEDKIDFLDIAIPNKSLLKNKLKLLFSNKCLAVVYNFYKNYKFKNEIVSLSKNDGKTKLVDLEDYNVIHFHTTKDMYECREYLKEYNGKVILTSHSPKPMHQELVDKLNIKNNKKEKKFIDIIEKIDIYAFNRADYIIFPTKESEECYYNTWDKYSEIHKKNSDKYLYLPTGIKKCQAKINREEVRKKYNIPTKSFLISYAGRHNEVKGYGDLKKIASKILDSEKDIHFIIAGTEGPLYRLENDRWIEVGWTNDPHSIISASNLFILPNKQTYFDLILLEVLSLGVPVLTSYTGGNKYFKHLKNNGILFYNSIDDAIKKIKKIKKIDLSNYGLNNEKIFDKYFNEKIFAQNYIELINNLEDE